MEQVCVISQCVDHGCFDVYAVTTDPKSAYVLLKEAALTAYGEMAKAEWMDIQVLSIPLINNSSIDINKDGEMKGEKIWNI